MVGFSFHNGGRRCIRQILEKYQAGRDHFCKSQWGGISGQVDEIDWDYGFRNRCPWIPGFIEDLFYLDKGESEGYIVKSKDEDFPISDYPLLQTEFFFDQKQDMATILYPIMLSQLWNVQNPII